MSDAIAGLYRVRLTVEGMKHSIEQVLLDHDGTLRATVEHEVKAAVDKFDFAGCVKSSAEAVIRTLVSQAIDRAVRDAFLDPQVNSMLNLTIIEHLRQVLNR